MEIERRRIWVDEQNSIFRRGLVSCLISGGFDVHGESAGLSPIPDVAVLDILLFEVAGASLSKSVELVKDTPTRLIGIAHSVSEEILFHAVEAGLAGFLIRSDLTPDSLVNAARTVASGNGAIPPRLLSRLIDDLARAVRPRATTAGQLIARELSVLRLLADGENTRDIANALSYSERTIKNIVHDTLMKLNCRTRAQAVALAARQGMI